MINEIKSDVQEIKADVKQAFNHMSNRLPKWATGLIAFMAALLTGLIVAVVK